MKKNVICLFLVLSIFQFILISCSSLGLSNTSSDVQGAHGTAEEGNLSDYIPPGYDSVGDDIKNNDGAGSAESDHQSNNHSGDEPNGSVGQEEPEVEVPSQTEIKYVHSYSGKYIYCSEGRLSAGSSDTQSKYVYQSLSSRFLSSKLLSSETGRKEVLDKIDKTMEITIGGKNVELMYLYSNISEFEKGSVQQKYIDRHVYQATDGTSATYEFSIQNGKLLTYNYLSGAQNAEGGTAESRAKEIALSFLRDQVGEKYSEYEMYGGKYTNFWGGHSFQYTFIRCIHGYRTFDEIQIVLSGSGKVCAYYADVQGVFDDYEDVLTKDLLDAALFELNDSVYGHGKNLTDRATVYIDENCNFYLGLKTTLGYEFYIEIDVDQ